MNQDTIARIEQTIVTLHQAGTPLTNDNVRHATGIGRNTVKAFMKRWRAQQTPSPVLPSAEVEVAASSPAMVEPVPVQAQPAPRPGPQLWELAQAYQAAIRARELAQRQEQAAAQALQEAKIAGRAALAWLQERSRVARQAPVHELGEAFAAQEAAREGLARYVGEGDAALAAEHPAYVPALLR